MLKLRDVTLEPNEANSDGASVTLYFTDAPSESDVLEFVRGMRRPDIPLWVDTKDPYFSVVRTKHQPRKGETRYQAYPTA